MNDTSSTQFQQFWSELLRGEPAAHKQAFGAFEEQLAAFAKGAGDAGPDAAGTYAQTLVQAFQALGQSPLRPPESSAGPAAACVRFTAVASALQSRFSQANAAAAAQVQARNTVGAPDSLQELFDRWVGCYEQHLFELLVDAEFGAEFGDAVNAALECYRDTMAGDARHAVGQQQALAELRHGVEALAARVANLDARRK
ncbi:MAG: hypothetical protein OET44_10000 [Gammaproteobacteria bacterium]|nr:hypothetical protein [Gammaproteobacteria bacterium]